MSKSDSKKRKNKPSKANDKKKSHDVASSNDAGRRISKEEINRLPVVAWTGKTVLCGPSVMAEAVDRILVECRRSCGILGFDTETRPVFRKGQKNRTALIQLATPDRVYLFRICQNPQSSFAPLLPIFESSRIIKCGVGIHGDVRELLLLKRFTPRGFIDIQEIARELNYAQTGLRNLAAMVMGGRMDKGAQMSNWERMRLDKKQIKYAATDAWISRELYLRMTDEKQAAQNKPNDKKQAAQGDPSSGRRRPNQTHRRGKKAVTKRSTSKGDSSS